MSYEIKKLGDVGFSWKEAEKIAKNFAYEKPPLIIVDTDKNKGFKIVAYDENDK